MPTSRDVLAVGLHLVGGRYVLGAKNPGPDKRYQSDCSGYISGIAHALGIPMAAGSLAQESFFRQHGTYQGGTAGVNWARNNPGAVLFRHAGTGGHAIGHVAIVASYNKTLEYRGREYGSGSWGIAGRPFTGGGLIPGVNYNPGPPPAQPPPVTLPSRPILGPGSAGPCVLYVQQVLNILESRNMPMTGVWDAWLEQSVADWQKILQIPVTRILDTKTWNTIDLVTIQRGQTPRPC